MGCCWGHHHGPWCWDPYRDYRPPPRRRDVEAQDLEELLRRLEAEVAEVRRRIDERAERRSA